MLNAATAAIIIAGLTLLLGRFGGLYWLLVTIAIYFPWAIINAWYWSSELGEKPVVRRMSSPPVYRTNRVEKVRPCADLLDGYGLAAAFLG